MLERRGGPLTNAEWNTCACRTADRSWYVLYSSAFFMNIVHCFYMVGVF